MAKIEARTTDKTLNEFFSSPWSREMADAFQEAMNRPGLGESDKEMLRKKLDFDRVWR